MSENSAPRQILRELVQGIAPGRSLFVPIAFALASRIDNLPLPSFLTNPTKISNALRQMRPPLHADGVSCYFDQWLEVEALGAAIERNSQHEPAKLRWPAGAQPGQLPPGLASPDDIVKLGRVPVALDVIRRLKALLRDETLLMAGVCSPLTLAARLAGLQTHPAISGDELPDAAVQLAAATITQISKAFAEAGVNLVFITEEVAPAFDAESTAQWLSVLAPIFNIIRFYEALPLLQLAATAADTAGVDQLLRSQLNCVVSLPFDTLRNLPSEARANIANAKLALSLPPSAFRTPPTPAPDFDSKLEEIIREARPAIVTTTADLPIATDPKRVAAVSEIIRRSK